MTDDQILDLINEFKDCKQPIIYTKLYSGISNQLGNQIDSKTWFYLWNSLYAWRAGWSNFSPHAIIQNDLLN